MTIEAIKQQHNFDEKLAAIIMMRNRQPSKNANLDMGRLVQSVRERVNPELIDQANQWKSGSLGPVAGDKSQHGDIRFRPTDEFKALLRNMVVQYGERIGLTLNQKELRKLVNQLRVATDQGVAQIRVARRPKKPRSN
ncbi:MAG: hypothetical protein Q8S20_15935 [Sulfuritalea sp.]|nr:hypothetical protein [Sulfuritalea sp.]